MPGIQVREQPQSMYPEQHTLTMLMPHNMGDTDQDLFDDMLRYYNWWKQILEISVGEFSEEKNTYYALDWAFSIGGKPTMIDAFVMLDSARKDQLKGQQIKITKNHKSLGHLISPKNQENAHIQQMQQLGARFNSIL